MSAKTLTLNLPDREAQVLSDLADHHDMSKTAVLRQALRLYQLVHHRLQSGETLSFSGDQQRLVEFVGVGLGLGGSGTATAQEDGE